MTQDASLSLVLDGHRDSAEPVGLSLTRLNLARWYMVEEKGIASNRIILRNFGNTCPHESGDRALNRRVEVWLLPKGARVDEIHALKKCAAGAAPKVITGGKPAPWKGPRTDWEGI
ncbi:MAG TPA: hypothetical protein VNO70_00725 [Blastocatellia bacterium]|nr:hypothetical protein [Blastocatellia bacterium]